jgi:hypothetical protein
MTWLPWWLGGPALALPTVVYWVAFRRPMGMSSTLARVVKLRTSLEEDEVADAMADSQELERAMREATLAEFGATALEEAAPVAPTPSVAPPPSHVHVSQNVALLAGIVLGGSIVALATHRFHPTVELPPALHATPLGWIALIGGGVSVGFGARLGGGCTSGHGLSGCARLALPSFVATFVFLGCAVATALAMGGT